MPDTITISRKLLEQAHATMRACGWHLALASQETGDGVLELACVEIEEKINLALRSDDEWVKVDAEHPLPDDLKCGDMIRREVEEIIAYSAYSDNPAGRFHAGYIMHGGNFFYKHQASAYRRSSKEGK